jgi:hypothetical protein
VFRKAADLRILSTVLRYSDFKCVAKGSKAYDKSKAVPLHAMEVLGGRGGIAPTHSRPH